MSFLVFKTPAKKKEKATSISDAVLTMRAATTKLEVRIEELDKKKKEDQDKARQLVRTDKRRALMALKRSKMLDMQVHRLLETQLNVETQLMQLQNVELSHYIVGAMKAGNSAMKSIDGFDIDSVDDTVTDTQEMLDIAREISDALGQPMGEMNFDELELERELAELEGNVVGELLYGFSEPVESKPQGASSPTKTDPYPPPPMANDELDKYEI